MLLFCSALFVLLILFSIFKPNSNPGYPAFFLAILIAPFTSIAAAANPLELFPFKLFFTLLGVTLFFVSLNSKGLISAIVSTLFRKAERTPRLIPPSIFLLVAMLTAIGIGNIGSVALIAPLAIPLASKFKISPFVMTILIVGGANAASFSPLTLPGILTHSFLHRTDFLKSHPHFDFIQWWIFWLVFICISTTTLLSYKLLKSKVHVQENPDLPKQLATAVDLKDVIKSQKSTITIVGIIASIFLIANISSIPFISDALSPHIKNSVSHFRNVGTLGWIGSALLIFTGHSHLRSEVKKVPWSTIVLVCGMSTYIELLSGMGIAESIANFTEKNTPAAFLPSTFAASSGIVSAFSSSVGVALPMFLPIVESISQSLTPSLAAVLVYSLAIGSHLVDASPLSTLGALCLSQVEEKTTRDQSYRALLIYSFVMIPAAGLWGFLLYLLLK